MQWSHAAEQFTNALASSDPTPGGGAAGVMAGAMGCALVLMAIGTTLKRKSTPPTARPALEQAQKKLIGLHNTLKGFIQQDSDAYTAYLTATKLPKDNPARTQAVQDALWFAACVPADSATTCLHVLKEAATVRPLIDKIILSDIACAQHLLKSAIACSAENIRANLAFITDTARIEKLNKQLETFL